MTTSRCLRARPSPTVTSRPSAASKRGTRGPAFARSTTSAGVPRARSSGVGRSSRQPIRRVNAHNLAGADRDAGGREVLADGGVDAIEELDEPRRRGRARDVVQDEQRPVVASPPGAARSRPSRPGPSSRPGRRSRARTCSRRRPACRRRAGSAARARGRRPRPTGGTGARSRARRAAPASPRSRTPRPSALAERPRVGERVVADPVALGVRALAPARGARAAARRRRRTSPSARARAGRPGPGAWPPGPGRCRR